MTHGVALISEAYDYPSAPGAGPPRHLLICTTPRTGGHALCSIFTDLGWGVPLEYFHPDAMVPLQGRWLRERVQSYTAAIARLEPYSRALMQNRVRHGLFSIKLFPDQHRLYQQAFINDMPGGFIRLSRKDKVAQAISCAALLTTRRAFDGEAQLRFLPRIGELTEAKMLQILRWIHKSEAYWDAYLSQIGPERRLNLIWEQTLVDPITTFTKIAAQFDLPFSSETIELSKAPYDQDAAIKAELTARFGVMLTQESHELYGHQH